MMERLDILDFGPHEAARVDLRRTTRVVGRSETGKSTLIAALSFVLWGETPEGARTPGTAVRDGADAARVEVTVGDVVLARDLRGPRHDAYVSHDDGATWGSVTTGASWRRYLGPLDSQAARVVLIPHLWKRLADGPGGGRALRDVLASVLPRADRAATVRELFPALRDNDPLDAKGAEDMRRDAGREADRAEGAADALAASLAGAPTEDELSRARSEIEAYNAWTEARYAYDAAVAWHRERDTAAAALAAWTERHAAVGPCPPGPTEAQLAALELASDRVRAASVARQRALADAAAHAAQVARVRVRLDRAERDLGACGDAPPTDAPDAPCPACGGVGPALVASRVRRAEAWRAAVADARRRRDDAAAELAALEDDPPPDAPSEVPAWHAHSSAQAAVQAARAAPDAWRRTVAALGPRPTDPPATVPPVPPDPGPRPDVSAAVAVRDRAPSSSVRASAAQARAAAIRARAEHTHLAALLAAIRAAPGVEAQRVADALGDTGPVRFIFGDKVALQVTMDGRPWEAASTGAQVVCDAWVRATVRRLARVDVPLFVDGRQDLAGRELPAFERMIELVTDDCDFKTEGGA